jgi:long-chain acyl-CoA synthetase
MAGQLARGAVANKSGQPNNEGGLAKCLLSTCLNDRMIMKIKEGLGIDCVRIFASGGAPLSPETHKFVQSVLAPVAQGWGATETTGGSSVQEVLAANGRPADGSTGAVGAVLPCLQLKLKSVPEMGYLVTDTDPRGEILVAGNSISQRGYFKNEAKTREDFPVHEDDGLVWFHTGDIGQMTGAGTLKIIDRKKDLIKLSAGEYVSLGKVEAGLKNVAGIGACCVFARSDKDHCVVIVSQPERGWASIGGKPASEEALVKAIGQELRNQGMSRFEIPTKVKLDDAIWTPESGLVTASLKVQRNPIRNHYNGAGGLLEQMDYKFPDA